MCHLGIPRAFASFKSDSVNVPARLSWRAPMISSSVAVPPRASRAFNDGAQNLQLGVRVLLPVDPVDVWSGRLFASIIRVVFTSLFHSEANAVVRPVKSETDRPTSIHFWADS